jgi:hypothetical protein
MADGVVGNGLRASPQAHTANVESATEKAMLRISPPLHDPEVRAILEEAARTSQRVKGPANRASILNGIISIPGRGTIRRSASTTSNSIALDAGPSARHLRGQTINFGECLGGRVVAADDGRFARLVAPVLRVRLDDTERQTGWKRDTWGKVQQRGRRQIIRKLLTSAILFTPTTQARPRRYEFKVEASLAKLIGANTVASPRGHEEGRQWQPLTSVVGVAA